MKSTHNRALETLSELANLREDDAAISRFLKSRREYLNEEFLDQVPDDVVRDDVLGLRNKIRKLWRGGEVANEIAREFLLAKEVIHYGAEDEKHVEFSPDAINVDWDRGKLVLTYKALDSFQASIYELLQVSRFAKICARAECPAPYFIAKKIVQQYCSDECKYAVREEIQKNYWNRRGSKRRKERKGQSKRRKRGNS